MEENQRLLQKLQIFFKGVEYKNGVVICGGQLKHKVA